MPNSKKAKKRSTENRRYANTQRSKLYGHKFDSKREARRYLDLRDRQKLGLIAQLEVHPRIAIVIGGVQVRYPPTPSNKKGRAMSYVADFRYYDVGLHERIIEDVKMQSGFLTEIYKFKRALLHTMGLKINEV